MHTFFVNTSENINITHHEPVFDKLMSGNVLKTFNYKLEELDLCAEKIAEVITRSSVISEVYNIIVYVEIDRRNEDALVSEMINSLIIEESLFLRLYNLGRRPRGALILFGENFTRDRQYGHGEAFSRNIRRALWESFPIPDVDTTRKMLKKIRSAFPDDMESDSIEYKRMVWATLTEYCTDKPLKSDNNFVVSTLYQMAESVCNDDLDSVDLLDELYIALMSQKGNVQERITVEKIKYAHVRLMNSDFNANNRSEYGILLYVYYCAIKGNFPLYNDLVYAGEGIESEATLCTQTIPDINWGRLSTELRYHKSIFEAELRFIGTMTDEFCEFNEAILQDKVLLSFEETAPKLIVEAKAHGGLTVSQLKNAVESTIKEIEDKNAKNESEIVSFVTRLTDAFNRGKDDLMDRINYKNSSKSVRSLEETSNKIASELDKAEAEIASRKRLSMNATHIDEILKDARNRTEYYFECLKKGWLIYIIGLVFTLAFAIPYTVIQSSLFEVFKGWLFYVATIAVIIGAYTLGYMIFRRIYKRRIIKVLSALCDKFTVTQKERQECLVEYEALIKKYIPLSYCLGRYKKELNDFIKKRKAIPEYGTYHVKQLTEYIRYISNILDELEIGDLGTPPEPINDYRSGLVIGEDKYKNNTVYVLIDDSSLEDLFVKHEEGEDLT